MAVDSGGADRRLESWKEIAQYLGRTERTVRRWEQQSGLPVHRLAHEKGSSVFAYAADLDSWREGRVQRPEPGGSASAPRRRWIWPVLAAAVAGIALFFAGWPSKPPPAKNGSQNPEALSAFQQGSNFFRSPGYSANRTAITYLEKAVMLDPTFAEGWESLSMAYTGSLWWSNPSPRAVIQKIENAAQKAIELDPKRAQGWARLAYTKHLNYDYPGSERAFRAAIAQGPGAKYPYALALLDLGRYDEAIENMGYFVTNSPGFLMGRADYGFILAISGRIEESIRELRTVLEAEPNHGQASFSLGRAYLEAGRTAEAVTELRRAHQLLEQNPISTAYLAYALARGGQRAEALALRDKALVQRRNEGFPAHALATIELGLGEYDSALNWLETAIDERLTGYLMPSVDSLWDPVRADPRFPQLLKKMNLEDRRRRH